MSRRRLWRWCAAAVFAAMVALGVAGVWTGDRRWWATAAILAVPMLVLAAAGHESTRRGTTPSRRVTWENQ